MKDTPRRALVTGASSGIGLELAKILAHEGFELVLCGRNEKALNELASSLKVKTEVVASDLGTQEGQKALLDAIQKSEPDLVINNAGLGYYGEASLEESQEIIDVNCSALVASTIEACRMFRAQKKPGIVCNISSAIAFIPAPLMSVYGASKAFVNAFSFAQDIEMKAHGIRVLASCPGQVATAFRRRASKGKPQQKSGGSDLFVMRAENVAKEIYQQIQKREPLRIIDWKTRALIFMARLLPRWLVEAILQKEVQKRTE